MARQKGPPPWARSAGEFRGMAGTLPSQAAARAWRRALKQKIAAKHKHRETPPDSVKRSVVALKKLIESDGIVRMYVEQMIEAVAPDDRVVEDIPELLAHLDHILEIAPEWEENPHHRVFFPVSALFSDMMITTPGEAAFRNVAFNGAIREVLREWCDFLDSENSLYVLNKGPHGWLSPNAIEYNKLHDFEIPDQSPDAPHWGWTSFNAFFHREIMPKERPINGKDDPKVIVSANDGAVYKIARGVKALDQFWIKGEPYSLNNMLDSGDYLDRFTGGDVFQSYLSGADYHRWHSPIDGTVRHANVVEGLMFSNLEWAGDDIKGVKSQGFYTAVNTRGLTFIESNDPTIGIVCCMPVGITEISSISLTAGRGDRVKKGDQLGYFSYGGSSVALIFQKGAINHFTVESPKDPTTETIPIKVNAQIAVAN